MSKVKDALRAIKKHKDSVTVITNYENELDKALDEAAKILNKKFVGKDVTWITFSGPQSRPWEGEEFENHYKIKEIYDNGKYWFIVDTDVITIHFDSKRLGWNNLSPKQIIKAAKDLDYNSFKQMLEETDDDFVDWKDERDSLLIDSLELKPRHFSVYYDSPLEEVEDQGWADATLKQEFKGKTIEDIQVDGGSSGPDEWYQEEDGEIVDAFLEDGKICFVVEASMPYALYHGSAHFKPEELKIDTSSVENIMNGIEKLTLDKELKNKISHRLEGDLEIEGPDAEDSIKGEKIMSKAQDSLKALKEFKDSIPGESLNPENDPEIEKILNKNWEKQGYNLLCANKEDARDLKKRFGGTYTYMRGDNTPTKERRMWTIHNKEKYEEAKQYLENKEKQRFKAQQEEKMKKFEEIKNKVGDKIVEDIITIILNNIDIAETDVEIDDVKEDIAKALENNDISEDDANELLEKLNKKQNNFKDSNLVQDFINKIMEATTNEELIKIEHFLEDALENNEIDEDDADNIWEIMESRRDQIINEDEEIKPITMCIYQFPADMTKEDLRDAKRFNLEVLGKVNENGFQPGDILIKGLKRDLDRYCDESLGYVMHPDYLYKAENVDLDEILEPFVKDAIQSQVANRLFTWDLKDFENYNEQYKRGDFRGSEATPFNLEAIKKWISIRNDLTYVDDPNTPGNWEAIHITQFNSKYGNNYIFIEPEQKLWRTRKTGDEFYHGPAKYYKDSIKDESEVAKTHRRIKELRNRNEEIKKELAKIDAEYEEAKQKLEDEWLEKRAPLDNELGENKIAIGENEGYLRELEEIDGMNRYDYD